MRRLIATVLLVVAVPLLLAFELAADPGGEAYRVRVIFDNVAAAVPGEDVKVAGATVGRIAEMDVTREAKAAVVLEITEAGFAPFRADARCTVRPQSLIGEKFVECEPGSASAARLPRVPSGSEGAGQDLLTVDHTSSPVDLDLINNTLRRPYGERFALLLNELGTGLAGRGDALNEAIHRANPALRETDRVLALLAAQNRTLADLARDSDRALAPLARDRRRLGGFVTQAGRTAQASAERRDDIERTFRRLPRFLRELRPTMVELGVLTREFTPVLSDLRTAAPSLGRLTAQMAPFARAGTPALRSLGEAADVGRPALRRFRPVVGDLRRLGREGRPTAAHLSGLLASLDATGGIARLMDFVYYSMTAINGFDAVGHYLRVAIIVNSCSLYATQKAVGCNSNFTNTRVVAAGQRREEGDGASGASAAIEPRLAGDPGEEGPTVAPGEVERRFRAQGPAAAREREENIDRVRRGARRRELGPDAGGSVEGGPAGRGEPLLDYLLGSER